MEAQVMQVNGKEVTREAVKDWLRSKHVTLWGDYIVTDPGRMEKAVDWFMGEIGSFADA